MVEMSGGNPTNRVKVSNTKAEYYSNLTETYMEQTKGYMEICLINTERSQQQYEEITLILADLPAQKEAILTEITNLANDKIEDIEETTELCKTEALAEMNIVKSETADYANIAKNWANKTDGKVDDIEYSAKYYALQAKSTTENAVEDIANATESAKDNVLADIQNATDYATQKLRGLQYPVFCFNSGGVNDNGEAALCSLNNDILTQHAPCVCTTSDGQTYIVNEDVTLDISELPDGEYNVFYFPETKEMKAYANTIYIQDCQPAWSENDIWVDTSVMPYVTKQNISGIAQVVKCVPNAHLVVSQTPKIENKPYNYGIRKGQPPLTYGNISNNINSAPELVKWKLEDGVLTLLSGSIARWAAGTQAPTLNIGDLFKGYPIVDISWDGTRLIYYTQTQQDYSWTFSTYTGYVQMFLQDAENAPFWGLQTDMIYSGTNNTVTTDNRVFYDADDNTCVHARDNIAQSFPLMKCFLNGASGITTICDTYQTGGCIGSTIWHNKNVSENLVNKIDSKCGLASIEHTTEYDYFITFAPDFNRINGNMWLSYNIDNNEKGIYLSTVNNYDVAENYVYNFQSGNNAITYQCLIGTNLTIINGQIQSYTPRMPFRAADAQDIDGRWIFGAKNLANAVALPKTAPIIYDVSSALPKDGKIYEVDITGYIDTANTANAYSALYIKTDLENYRSILCRIHNQVANQANQSGGNLYVLVGAKRQIIVDNHTSNTGTFSLDIKRFRRVR